MTNTGGDYYQVQLYVVVSGAQRPGRCARIIKPLGAVKEDQKDVPSINCVTVTPSNAIFLMPLACAGPVPHPVAKISSTNSHLAGTVGSASRYGLGPAAQGIT